MTNKSNRSQCEHNPNTIDAQSEHISSAMHALSSSWLCRVDIVELWHCRVLSSIVCHCRALIAKPGNAINGNQNVTLKSGSKQMTLLFED